MIVEEAIIFLKEKNIDVKFEIGNAPDRTFFVVKGIAGEEICENSFLKMNEENQKKYLLKIINSIDQFEKKEKKKIEKKIKQNYQVNDKVKVNFDNYIHKLEKIDGENFYVTCKGEKMALKKMDIRPVSKLKQINCVSCIRETNKKALKN